MVGILPLIASTIAVFSTCSVIASLRRLSRLRVRVVELEVQRRVKGQR